MLIYLPVDLDPEEQREAQRRATSDWLLFGEIHMTNAHRLTFLNPAGIKYTPQPTDQINATADSTADLAAKNDRW